MRACRVIFSGPRGKAHDARTLTSGWVPPFVLVDGGDDDASGMGCHVGCREEERRKKAVIESIGSTADVAGNRFSLQANSLFLCTRCTPARFLSHASLRILPAAQAGRTLFTYAPGVVLRPRVDTSLDGAQSHSDADRPPWTRRACTTVHPPVLPIYAPDFLRTIAPHALIPTPIIARIRFPATTTLRRTTVPRSSRTVSVPPPPVAHYPRAYPFTRRVKWYASFFTNAPSRSLPTSSPYSPPHAGRPHPVSTQVGSVRRATPAMANENGRREELRRTCVGARACYVERGTARNWNVGQEASAVLRGVADAHQLPAGPAVHGMTMGAIILLLNPISPTPIYTVTVHPLSSICSLPPFCTKLRTKFQSNSNIELTPSPNATPQDLEPKRRPWVFSCSPWIRFNSVSFAPGTLLASLHHFYIPDASGVQYYHYALVRVSTSINGAVPPYILH
ncbi:hypothetical protein C8R44DRAFT_863285 [Mycena epipterygia]|nr:hypothetical protein C8R44DRAFT_863285 [Mycena epipterygia]